MVFFIFKRIFCKQTVETLITHRRMSDLGLHGLSITRKKEAMLIWVNKPYIELYVSCFFFVVCFFFKNNFLKNSLRRKKQIVPRSGLAVRPDLGPICLQRLSAGNELKWVLLLFLIECKMQEPKYIIETCFKASACLNLPIFFFRKIGYINFVPDSVRHLSVCP